MEKLGNHGGFSFLLHLILNILEHFFRIFGLAFWTFEESPYFIVPVKQLPWWVVAGETRETFSIVRVFAVSFEILGQIPELLIIRPRPAHHPSVKRAYVSTE